MQREQSPRTSQDPGGRSPTQDGPGTGGPGRRSARDRVLAARGTAEESTRAAGPPDAAGSTAAATDPGERSRHEGLELEERLGEGEGTRTWRARERSSREEFTVTFAVSEDPAVRRAIEEQFVELAGEWSRREHPHLVCVRATLGDGARATALVTQQCAGTTLAQRMRTQGRLSPEEVSPVLSAVARALAQLHERGWVHGRLTPEHVLLTPDREVVVDGYGARCGAEHPGPAWGLGERGEAPAAPPHGSDTTPSRPGSHDPLPAYLHHDDVARPGAAAHAPERVPPSGRGVMTPAGDVHALGVLGWRALTGRLPGPDSHRVPLTLMCPAAPRHLVLMLEAALCDDPAERPTAHELAAGFDTAVPVPRPSRAPARRPEERMTPEVVRADGTVVRPRRLRRSDRTGGRGPSGATGAGSRHPSPERVRDRHDLRNESPGHRLAGVASEVVGTDFRRRWWLALGAALVVVATMWGATRWVLPGEAAAGPEMARSSTTASTAGAGAESPGAGPTAGPGEPRPQASGSGQVPTGRSSDPSTNSASPDAPGASAQDRSREARQAVRDLVAARAAALAAGDETAVNAVYVPQSQLAARDREVIRRARAQDTGATGLTAFSGIRMEVVELAEEKRARDARVSPAEAARTRSYRAEVVTRGWHGDVPAGSLVTRKGGDAVQSLRISVVQTPEGWRLTDVTPVASGR